MKHSMASGWKSLLVFPALSLVVAVSCAPIDSAPTSLDDGSSTSIEGQDKGESPNEVIDQTTVVPKGADSTGSADVDANGAQITDTTAQQQPQSPVGPQNTQGTLALSVLQMIRQENEAGAGYDRDLFRHWNDADGNGCTTRQDVLIAESLSLAQVDRFGCKVIAGDWFSAFDGLTHTDPSDLDIDHLVPLKEAWDSGAHSWSSSKRERFANDMSDGRALIAVTNSVNRSKSDRDPSQWLPPRNSYVCTYISDWIAVKFQWQLSMDSSEWGRLKNLLSGQCVGTTIAPWGTVSSSTAQITPTPSMSPSPPTTVRSLPRSTTTSTTIANSAPTLAPVVPTEPSNEEPLALPTIRPGAFCTPEGGLGQYSTRVYLCAKKRTTGEPYTDGRARWRQR